MTHPSDQRIPEAIATMEAEEQIGYYGCPRAIGALRMELFPDGPVPPCSLLYEGLIWWLHIHDNPYEWGTTFGPWITQKDANGNRIEDPPLTLITSECLEYWLTRMRNSKHHVVRARFAHCVWDLSYAA